MSFLKLHKVSKIVESHGYISIFKSGKEHECTYLKASEMDELKKTDKWEFHAKKWDYEKKHWFYIYRTKNEVTYVVTKYSAYYTAADKFKRLTDKIYVYSYENWTVFHMAGAHRS